METETNSLYAIMVVGGKALSKLYETLELAEEEAKRLTDKKNKTTYVLRTIIKFERGDVKKTEIVNLK